MAKKRAIAPRKIKTLVPEPDWKKLQEAKTEEKMFEAWNVCEDFVHNEVTDKEKIHSTKKWIKSNWDLTSEHINMLPDVYISSFAKNGWKAIRLGFMPEKVQETLRKHLLPIFNRAEELRDRMYYEPPIHPSLAKLDEDNDLHPKKVQEWLKEWKHYLSANKKYAESDDSKVRQEYQIAQTYVSNMNIYLKSAVWLDHRYGLKREFSCAPVVTTLAYDKDGLVKRNYGMYYPDIGMVWKE
jgi:hypothetical protein